ncbi:MAG: calcium/sodium antiporter [Verrucomicrobiota bacterium]
MSAIPDLMLLNLLFFVIGLVIIVKASDIFLESAIWIAEASGIPQVIIGATIVSLGTTLPEVVSSCTAAFQGVPDMAVGNAVGSVVCNTGLVLGAVVFFITTTVKREVFLIKGAFMLAGLLFVLCMGLPDASGTGPVITRNEGIILLVFLTVYLIVNYYESMHAGAPPAEVVESVQVDKATQAAWARHIALFAGGAVFVAAGAFLLVEFGQRLAGNIGISEAVVSLAFVAFGTSLPELFTGISAIRKKAEHVSVGNIFGANVLNMALVIGLSATITDLRLKDAFLVRFDIPVALGLGAIVFVTGLWRGKADRFTGIVLLLIYVAYMASLFLLGRTPT